MNIQWRIQGGANILEYAPVHILHAALVRFMYIMLKHGKKRPIRQGLPNTAGVCERKAEVEIITLIVPG